MPFDLLLHILTQLQAPVFIQPQQIHRRPADCGQADDLPVVIGKMFIPIVETGMKQARQLFGFWIEAGKVRALVQIAVMAGKREVFRRVFSAVLSRNDVFDVKSQRLEILMQPAIFTTIFCALPDELSQPGVHQFAVDKMRRALA